MKGSVELSTHSDNRSVAIVIPLYKSPHLVKALEQNLTERAEELRRCHAHVVFINDSPEDTELAETLRNSVKSLQELLSIEVLHNEKNLGFVSSANRGLQWCVDHGADALLLNSDALLADNCLTELRRVSLLDPMIGMVCPRSNNATICSLPFRWAEKHLPFNEALATFEKLHRHLPEWHFVPTGIGFCMYIRNLVLKEFGMLDEAYSPGYHEENDFCCRANRCGFRVAMANHAFCYHDESVSFGSKKKQELNKRNQTILDGRYPEYQESVSSYFASPEFCFEQTLTAIVQRKSDTPTLLIDLSHFRSAFNGTYEYGKKIARALINLNSPQFKISLMCGEHEARYHNLHSEFPEVSIIPPSTDEVFDLALKPAQPFSLDDVARLSKRALLNFYVMLDTIALDCAYIRPRALHSLWNLMSRYSDGFVFISQFSQDQFTRRFRPSAHTALLPALCSTDVQDYTYAVSDSGTPRVQSPRKPFVLILGNHYEHKFITPTVTTLLKNAKLPHLVVLGDCKIKDPRVTVIASGQLDEAAVDELYRDAEFIVFPSLYEGFGFPVLHGLARGKTVCARDSSLNREIIHSWNGGGELVLYRDTADLARLVTHLLSEGNTNLKEAGFAALRGRSSAHYGWPEVALKIATMMSDSFNRHPVSPLARERIEAVLGAFDAAKQKEKEREDSLRQEFSHQTQLFSEVVASPSFRIGKVVTTLLGKIPAVRPAYNLLRKN